MRIPLCNIMLRGKNNKLFQIREKYIILKRILTIFKKMLLKLILPYKQTESPAN